MNLDFLKDKKIAILGLGIEGVALTEFLYDKVLQITILDQSDEKKLLNNYEGADKDFLVKILKDEKIDKKLGEHYLEDLENYDVIYRSPGISYLNENIEKAKENGVLISSQIKLFFDLCSCKIIGVTGTKGKGTTASLIYEMIKKQKSQVYLAGNIGYPAISLLPKLKNDDIVILELSSFQLMDLEKSPYLAVVINLSVDHLDYHKNIKEYIDSKFNILKHQKEDNICVLNKNSTFDENYLQQVKSSRLFFSDKADTDAYIKKSDADIYEVWMKQNGQDMKLCDENSIKLFGRHNLENIAAAALAASALNVKIEDIKKTAAEFEGLPHRIEFVRELGGIKFINDSFATNPEPAIAAIDSFKQEKILILGGSSKKADFLKLARKIVSSNVKTVVLIGEESDRIKTALHDSNYQGQYADGGKNMDEIVKTAFSFAKSGDVVILSPACASFDLFKNYKDRGNKYKNAVKSL